MSNSPKYENLIPELAHWNNGQGISLDSWIGCIGRFDTALGYTAIFWPDFVEFEGGIFRRFPDLENYKNWLAIAKGDLAKVEAILNHTHLAEVFINSEYQPSQELLIRLGKLLREMWKAKLAIDFPQKHFKIELQVEGNDLIDIQITFFQE